MLSIQTLTLLAASTALLSPSSATLVKSRSLNARQDVNLLDINTYIIDGVQNGTAPPGQRPEDSAGQFISVTNLNGSDSFSQLSYCPTIFVTGAAVNGSFGNGGGWEGLPTVTYFDLKRDVNVGDATMPYYEEFGKDYANVKRVVMAMPGQPRDAWKYAQLVRNSLLCAAANDRSIDLASILIVAPQFLNTDDKAKGSGVATDLAWEGSAWSGVSDSRSPDGPRYSMMAALDAMTSHYFDKSKFPNLNSVMLSGHSLGASTVQRYSVLRKPTVDDTNLYSWIGNPGAYVWPIQQRPNTTGVESCPDYADWPTGLNATSLSTIPKYRRIDIGSNETKVLNQYLNRQTLTALGLQDTGSGTTQCAAFFQGASHLERGQNFFKALDELPNGKPSTFNLNFINTSHIDYQMYADPSTQSYLFGSIDNKNPQLVIDDESESSSGTGASTSDQDEGSSPNADAGTDSSDGPSGNNTSSNDTSASNILVIPSSMILVALGVGLLF